MECREARERLSAFADDELDAERSRELARHLDGCTGCAAELANLRRLGGALRDLEYHRAPDVLRARIARDVRASVRIVERAPAPSRAWRSLSAVAAALVVVLGGVWAASTLVPSATARDALVREAVDGHVRSLLATHLTDVTSTDRHTVKPWFAGRIDYAPPVEDFASEGFPLVGGRLDVLGGRPVAALVYRHRQHLINAFVWPDAREESVRTRSRRGYSVVTARHGGMAWYVVSDLNAGDLASFTRRLTGSAAR